MTNCFQLFFLTAFYTLGEGNFWCDFCPWLVLQVYRILVAFPDATWTVCRRYSEFYALNEEVGGSFPVCHAVCVWGGGGIVKNLEPMRSHDSRYECI